MVMETANEVKIVIRRRRAKNGFSHRTVDVARNRRIVEKHARATGNLRVLSKRGRVRVKLFASVLLLIELRRNMVQMSELVKQVD